MAACISLQGSKACPAFQTSSFSTTNSFLNGVFPFLQYVSSREMFDDRLLSYVQTEYVREKYQTLIGCGGINLTNTTELYARFTTTVMCNTIVQESINNCTLAPEDSRPVCADTCALFAQAEAYVVGDSSLCPNPGRNAASQIRADFTNCASPDNALSGRTCISGSANEPENCGYGNSTIGLCSYCAKGGMNSTDTCCYNSNAESRCVGVVLPSIMPTIALPTATVTSSPTATGDPNADAGGSRLSTGAIVGVVLGALGGVALLVAALFLLCRRRRQQGSQKGSIFNQPQPARRGVVTGHTTHSEKTAAGAPGFEVLPGGRIARMSALEGHSADSPSHSRERGGPSRNLDSRGTDLGSSIGYGGSRRLRDDHSSSDGFGDSPGSERGAAGILRPPPTTLRRTGSLSSSSVLAGDDPNSPTSGGMSSPQGMASQQSEQLPFFKDYYSQDDIHPGDRVAVLWAYQPRAADEFTLDRGDMLKVVGIWDDGWATGILVDEQAEQWEARRQAQRDSGVSNTSGRISNSPPASGEIKAFPLVCVCVPEHWRKTIEGDGSTETGSSAHPYTTTTGS
ncbi:Carcinoembryonic antigen-related cell adhesion molecule 1 [Cladorrhinum sp. PSN259]|nr:Carcinoembryonic antigen-related cell adhesion molecule 1 [Cladorrhinum sp. PSN259]